MSHIVPKVRRGEPRRHFAFVPVLQHDQATWIAIRQRPQQHTVHNSENRRRRPNSEGQGENCDATERRLASQYPTCLAQILKQSAHEYVIN